jgi:sarcosine oxidase subunit alpha
MAGQVEALDNCRILKNSTAFAWYDKDVLAVSGPGEFWELKPGRVIIATGNYETPMIFDNNDLSGIFTVGALQRLMHGDHIRPGNRAVVAAQVDEGYAIAKQLMEAGVNVIGIVDPRNKGTALSAADVHGVKEADAPLFSGSS